MLTITFEEIGMISAPGTPTLEQLRVFLTIVDVDSFAAAARKPHRIIHWPQATRTFRNTKAENMPSTSSTARLCHRGPPRGGWLTVSFNKAWRRRHPL